jgi:hypothetical protein
MMGDVPRKQVQAARRHEVVQLGTHWRLYILIAVPSREKEAGRRDHRRKFADETGRTLRR